MEQDYTRLTVTRQINALRSRVYELGIYNRETDQMIIKRVKPSEVFNYIKYLKYQNINGSDIFIRPAEDNALIFVDDLTAGGIERMENDGLVFAICLESSPQNYHGWISLDSGPLPSDLRTNIGRFLAYKYGADFRSSDWRHFGRLAGFTNQKNKYVNELGQQPYVNIYSHSNKTSKHTKHLIDAAIAHRDKLEQAKPRFQFKVDHSENLKGAKLYLKIIEELRLYWGQLYNPSDSDWNAVLIMIKEGYTGDEIASILLSHSESALKRSGKRAEDYVQRTVSKAISVSEINT